jgi:DHA1 family tetracycline resistance protein-like MFS transporter
MAMHRKAGIGFIFVTLFLDVLGIGIIIPILPNLVKGFAQEALSAPGGGLILLLAREQMTGEELASAWYGWLAAAYALMQFVFSPVIGALSDRFGRRPVLLASNFCQGVDYLLMAFAPSLGLLFIGRLIAGLTGASIGTATAYIADVTPPEKRSQSFGLIGIAFGLGFIVGPLMGGLLGAWVLRAPFFAAAVLTLANALWGFLVLPESLSAENRRPFLWKQANPFGTLSALGRYPFVLAMTATFFLANLGQRALESTWVLSTGHRYHWTERDAGISLAIVGVAAALVQGGLVRKIIPALGERRTLLLAGCCSIVAFVGYAFSPSGGITYCIIPFGALGGIAGPAIQGMLSKKVPPSEQGLLQGGLVSLTSLTSAIGPPIATSLFSYFISNRAPIELPGISFLFGASCTFLGLVFAVRAYLRYPEVDLPSPLSSVVAK